MYVLSAVRLAYRCTTATYFRWQVSTAADERVGAMANESMTDGMRCPRLSTSLPDCPKRERAASLSLNDANLPQERVPQTDDGVVDATYSRLRAR